MISSDFFKTFKRLLPTLCIAILFTQACTQPATDDAEEANIVETTPKEQAPLPKKKRAPIPSNLEVGKYPITWFNEGLGTVVDTVVDLVFVEENIGYFNFRYPPLKAMVPVENTLKLYSDSVSITIRTILFNKEKHRLEYDRKTIKRIDGRSPWGTDGSMPHTEIASIDIGIGEREISVPSEQFADLFEARIHPSNLNTHKGYVAQNQEIILNMMNGDGAGYYHVLFIFDLEGNVKQRFVGGGF